MLLRYTSQHIVYIMSRRLKPVYYRTIRHRVIISNAIPKVLLIYVLFDKIIILLGVSPKLGHLFLLLIVSPDRLALKIICLQYARSYNFTVHFL